VIFVNGDAVPAAAGTTVSDVLESLQVDPARRGIAVAVGSEVIPRGEWATRVLAEGERVEVVHAVQGG
jgi:sulfur carrier protein